MIRSPSNLQTTAPPPPPPPLTSFSALKALTASKTRLLPSTLNRNSQHAYLLLPADSQAYRVKGVRVLGFQGFRVLGF